MTAGSHQPTEGVSGPDGGSDAHGRRHGLVGRAGAVGMSHHDDSPTGDRPGEGDRAGRRRPHRSARSAEQVDAPMAR